MDLDYRLVLDSFADAVVASDESDCIVYVNQAVEKLLGWPRMELIGQPLGILMPSRMRGAHAEGFKRFIATHQPRIVGKAVRVPALHREGHEVDVELTLSAFRVGDGDLIVASMRDLRDRVELERQLIAHQRVRVQFEVVRVLMESRTLESAVPRLLEVIGDVMGWDVGLFWRLDLLDGVFKTESTWGRPGVDASAFLAASKQLTLKAEEGLVGSVWQLRLPAWSLDLSRDARYLRREAAADSNLSGAILFPVYCAKEHHGVLEFVSRSLREPDQELIQTLSSLGFQIGQFLERLEVERGERNARAQVERERTNLYALFNQAPAAIAILEGDSNRFTLANPLYQQLTGGAPLVGKTLEEAMPRDTASSLRALLDEVKRVGVSAVSTEVPVVLSSANDPRGQTHFINAIHQPLLNAEGRVQGVMVFASDVTEQVRARERLWDTQKQAHERQEREAQHFRALAETMPQIVWTANPDGRLDYYNQRWYDFTGLRLEDDWAAAIHPADLQGTADRWAQSVRTGQVYENEYRLRRKSDSNYYWYLGRALPVHDDTGQVVKWFGTATDIDDQKKSIEASRFLSEASTALGMSLDYRQTLQSVANLVVPQLADSCAVYLQEDGSAPPMLVAVAHVDPAKRAWAQAYHQEYPPDARSPRGVAAVIRTGTSELMAHIPEHLLLKAAVDDRQLMLLRELNMRSVMIVPLSAQGRTFGALVLMLSQTERRYNEADLRVAQEVASRAAHSISNAKLYDEAREAIQVRDEFLSIASHELRTPLTPLALHVRSIQRAMTQGLPFDSLRISGQVESMGRQVTRLGKLVSSLLDVSRIAGKRLTLDCEPLDLGALALEVVQGFREQAEASATPLVLDAQGRLDGQWDKLRLDQILVNLISNALKFSPGQPVEVALHGRPEAVSIRIKDHGIGINRADQDRIFGRFERAVSSRHYGGMGLGLWLTRQIVEAMGGTISVSSELGQGSTFAVELPRQTPTKAPHPRSPHPA